MWMRGYNDGGDQFSSNEDNSFGSRKFRPLMPRPGTGNSPGLARIYSHDLLTLNHHLAMVEQNKREICVGQQVIVSSRWNPTPEQLQTLEELYRRGTRTPSAEQIQYITAQLRRYGKIEGKNVFYWFQNHKARERQKRRRQESTSDELPTNHGDRKEPSPGDVCTGGRGNRRAVAAGIEVEETKNWVSPTNSRTLAEYEKSVSRQGGARAGGAESKGAGAGGWLQFNEDADPSVEGSGATWRMMQLSYPPSPSPTPTTLIPHTSCSSSSSTCPCSAPPTTTTLHSSPLLNTATHHHFIDMFATDHTHTTLQLFPIPNHQHDGDQQGQNGNEARVEAMTTANSAYQFFEFLPLKN